MKQTKKVFLTLSAVLMAAAAAMPAAAAQSARTLNYLNVQIAPIDDNFASTDYIQAVFTPDNGEETTRSQSCSGKIAATNFLDITSGTVTFHKQGYHTEPASWHVDTSHFDKQTLQFTLIPDSYTGTMRAAKMPAVSFDEVDTDADGSFSDPVKRLILKTETSDALIHYTTDGSEPGYESPLYTGPIRLEADTTFKAIAVKAGYVKSPVLEYQYQAPKKEAKRKSAAIYGRITDENGAVIPEAAVTYTYTAGETGSGISIYANENGEFSIYDYSKLTGTLSFAKEGYQFSPVEVTAGYAGETLAVKGTSLAAKSQAPETAAESQAPETAAETQAPETEAAVKNSSDTVKLYFMTGSSVDDPGEVFAEFDVPKNARGNKVTLAKTIKTFGKVPEKEGAVFSFWKERSLKDPTKMGNRIYGTIWTNDADQYLYAQYK